MILADTSVWADHIRFRNAQLSEALEAETLACHPFVVGELALGSLPNRIDFIDFLGELPKVRQASHSNVMDLIEANRLHSRGVGYMDMHLLASVMITEGAALMTYDKRMSGVAKDIGISVVERG